MQIPAERFAFLSMSLQEKLQHLGRICQFAPPNPNEQERAQRELVFRLVAQSKMMHSIIGLLTLAIATTLSIQFDVYLVWVWAALTLFFIACFSLLFIYINRASRSNSLPEEFSYAILVLLFFSCATWYSLPWWLYGQPTSVIYVGVAISTGLFVVGGFIGSSYLITTVGAIPVIFLIPLSLVFLTKSYLLALLNIAIIVCSICYSFNLVNMNLETIRQRHRAEKLAEQLRNEKAKGEEAAWERAILQERQRLMQDMHDGFGSTLITTASLLEHGELSVNQAADLIRDCINDLRLVVDSLEPLNNDLIALLASIRFRMGRKLELAGIQVVWNIKELPKLDWMTPTLALHFMRIVQEAISNITKHSGATKVVFTTEINNNHIQLSIEDNGCGFDIQKIHFGSGLKNQIARAKHLQGEINFLKQPQGMQVLLLLPLISTHHGNPSMLTSD